MTVLRNGRTSAHQRAADGSMPLLEHLTELRRRLVISAVAIVAGMIIAYIFFPQIFSVIKHPYCSLPEKRRQGGTGCHLYAYGILDQFKVRLKISLYAAILCSAPIWLYQFWAFITPGLHRHERRWTTTFVLTSILLFAGGVALAYLTLAKGLEFLLGVGGSGITTLVGVNTYLSYFTAMVLVFGLAFEFPLLLMMLNLTGLLTSARMRSWWRQMVLGITVFAAVATPSQDPFTMTALAVPLVALFFVCIGLAHIVDARRARRQAIAEAEIAEQLARIDAG